MEFGFASRFVRVGYSLTALLIFPLAMLLTVSCAKPSSPVLEKLDTEATPQPDPENEKDDSPPPSAVYRVPLDQAAIVRFIKDQILEVLVELPAGSVIEIPKTYQTHNFDYRKSDGGVERSSTGFMTPLQVVSVPDAHAAEFPAQRLIEINATAGGLYITAAIVGTIEGVEGEFAVLKPSDPSEGFNKNYEPSGKPKFKFTESIKKRFGDHLNNGVDPAKQTPAERKKWKSILLELRRAVERTVETKKSILMIDQDAAMKASEAYETEGVIPLTGAWTVAVQATAVRHGFPNVPCAEFQSEILRQAYARAGYDVSVDFNDVKHNKLIWSQTAAVVNFSRALDTAGWVPWDSTLFKPPTGAFLMNGARTSPGHTYISAGDDGRFIVDNGSPQGRDLRATSQKTIELMFQTGVFFLPPGINPKKW